MSLGNEKQASRHITKDLIVLTPLIPPRTTKTIAMTANTMPQNSFSHTGGSCVSSEPSIDIPARVTAMESHCVTSEIVIMISMKIFAIFEIGNTLNIARVSASAPSLM